MRAWGAACGSELLAPREELHWFGRRIERLEQTDTLRGKLHGNHALCVKRNSLVGDRLATPVNFNDASHNILRPMGASSKLDLLLGLSGVPQGGTSDQVGST